MKNITHSELALIYKEVFWETGKPVTVADIFKAMRAAYDKGQDDLKTELLASTELSSNILNDAGWVAIDRYREITGQAEPQLYFDFIKPILSTTIKSFIEQATK